jgi:soluble lytic murein transglycosylase
MKTQNRLIHLSLAYLTCLAVLSPETQRDSSNARTAALPKIETEPRVIQALELLDRKHKGLIFDLNPTYDLRQFLFNTVQFSLPRRYKRQAFEITKSIILEANHHGLDPFFLVAVIRTESQFNVKARGSAGEIGLMQVLPKTAKWMAPQVGLKENNINLEDPATNIRIGAAFFSNLRVKFVGRSSRYIAAYNMGAKNVRRLVKNSQEPAIYPNKVITHYTAIYNDLNRQRASSTLLSRREVASVD